MDLANLSQMARLVNLKEKKNLSFWTYDWTSQEQRTPASQPLKQKLLRKTNTFSDNALISFKSFQFHCFKNNNQCSDRADDPEPEKIADHIKKWIRADATVKLLVWGFVDHTKDVISSPISLSGYGIGVKLPGNIGNHDFIKLIALEPISQSASKCDRVQSLSFYFQFLVQF